MKDFKTIPQGIKSTSEEDVELMQLLDTHDVPSEDEGLYFVSSKYEGTRTCLETEVMTKGELIAFLEEHGLFFEEDVNSASNTRISVTYYAQEELRAMFDAKKK